ncbi:PREDICTED: E3 ubiquitin/ISG15 ligase TRIM25-like [Cyprinodon variegatus]|uniref:E3 ubiquitin/ISG15 ligase TRIM25-like n=1 Tax=Cyprinodon variegatus TaxID=28743 RepID=UPI0007425D16|nr:PREDICTED: E3 ubiquitin/ISG15 ligase TRIM25-like [Cyprinodon variegatus]
MAHSADLLDCSICLQLLDQPVTTACGHSYCMECINTFWDSGPNTEGTYSCPQCRTTFSPKPVLQRNTVLANLLDEHKKKSKQSAAADPRDALSPGDVPCDSCSEIKRKAQMYCLMCLASFCETHLQPHLQVPVLMKHKLIQASARIKESICSRHDRRFEIYCRTDEQLLCPLCVVQHKNHDIVEVTTEVNWKQEQLKKTRDEIATRTLFCQHEIGQLKQAAKSIQDAFWEVSDNFEQQCTEHIRLYVHYLERKCVEVREEVKAVEKTGVDWTVNHIGQLEREVHKLKGIGHNLRQLAQTDEPIQFLQDFQALGGLPVISCANKGPVSLAEFVSAKKDQMKRMCDKENAQLFGHLKDNTIMSVPRRPYIGLRSRQDMLCMRQYLAPELDPNTVHACLYMTNTKRELSWGITGQAHPDHPDRFTTFYQSMCKKGLKGNHYWEVEWDGGVIEVAVSYKGIQRKGNDNGCCFGHNKLSWKIICYPSSCTFWHNNLHKSLIPPAQSRRVGVHLQYAEGKLSFYSVSSSGSLSLLHQVQTTFTEPLYPGFTVDLGAFLKICTL